MRTVSIVSNTSACGAPSFGVTATVHMLPSYHPTFGVTATGTRLQFYAPRLQPYVPRLQPYDPRLQPYVPRSRWVLPC